MANPGCTARQMIQKLKLQTPDAVLVNHYLAEIAKAYKVDWSPAETEADPQGPFQSSVQQDQLYQSAPSYSVEVKLPISQQPAESAGQLFPEIPSGQSAGASSSGPDFEELEKRFEALKKKK